MNALPDFLTTVPLDGESFRFECVEGDTVKEVVVTYRKSGMVVRWGDIEQTFEPHVHDWHWILGELEETGYRFVGRVPT